MPWELWGRLAVLPASANKATERPDEYPTHSRTPCVLVMWRRAVWGPPEMNTWKALCQLVGPLNYCGRKVFCASLWPEVRVSSGSIDGASVKWYVSGVLGWGHWPVPAPASACIYIGVSSGASPHPPKVSCWSQCRELRRCGERPRGRGPTGVPAISFLLMAVLQRRLAHSPRAARPAP